MGLDIEAWVKYQDNDTRKLDQFEHKNTVTNKYDADLMAYKEIYIIDYIRNDHILKNLLIEKYKIKNCELFSIGEDTLEDIISLVEENREKYTDDNYHYTMDKLDHGLSLLKDMAQDKTMDIEDIYLRLWW